MSDSARIGVGGNPDARESSRIPDQKSPDQSSKTDQKYKWVAYTTGGNPAIIADTESALLDALYPNHNMTIRRVST